MFSYVGSLAHQSFMSPTKACAGRKQKHVLTVEQKLEILTELKSYESCLKIGFCKSFTLEN
jgi:hypothetical protein